MEAGSNFFLIIKRGGGGGCVRARVVVGLGGLLSVIGFCGCFVPLK